MSALRDTAIASITLARNYITYGVLVNGAALEGLQALAPDNDIVSGPQALISAVYVAGWEAQYAQAQGYILRAMTNSQLLTD
jgi:hypothetical protein